MTDVPQVLRLSKVAKEFNIGLQTIVEFLSKKGHHIEVNPNTKITSEMYDLLLKEFSTEKNVKEESRRSALTFTKKETLTIDETKPLTKESERELEGEELLIKDSKISKGKKEIFRVEFETPEIKSPKVLGKIDPDKLSPKTKPTEEKELVKQKDKAETAKLKKEKEKKEEEAAKEEKEKKTSKKGKKEEPAVEEAKEKKKETVAEKKTKKSEEEKVITAKVENESKIKVVGKIDLDSMNTKTKPDKKTKAEKEEERNAKLSEKKKKTLTKKGKTPEPEIEEEPTVIEEEIKEIPTVVEEKKE